MPAQYSWLLEGRVVLVRGFGRLTLADMEREEEIMRHYLNQTQGRVLHIIVDQTQLEALPDVKAMASRQWAKDDRVGWLVMFGAKNRIINFITAIATQLFRLRIRPVKDLAEAIAFLQNIDETLPDMSHVLEKQIS